MNGQASPRREAPSSYRHPLYGLTSALSATTSTRPNLDRKTSELDEQDRLARLSISSSTEESERRFRESFEVAYGGREGKQRLDQDIEVLIHEVQPDDSLAKIAVLYGIELSVLRKANKLWTADTIHLRRALYIPLAACNLKEKMVPGPDKNTLTMYASSHTNSSQHHLLQAEEESTSTYSTPPLTVAHSFNSLTNLDYGPAASRPSNSSTPIPSSVMPPTFLSPTSPTSLPLISPNTGQSIKKPESRTLSIVRIPASELAFFPKPRQSQTSLDIPPRHTSSLISSPIPFSSATLPSRSPPAPPNRVSHADRSSPSLSSRLSSLFKETNSPALNGSTFGYLKGPSEPVDIHELELTPTASSPLPASHNSLHPQLQQQQLQQHHPNTTKVNWFSQPSPLHNGESRRSSSSRAQVVATQPERRSSMAINGKAIGKVGDGSSQLPSAPEAFI